MGIAAGGRVLVVGWGDVADKHFRKLLEKREDLALLKICDKADRSAFVPASADFQLASFSKPLSPEGAQVAAELWDVAFVLTPPANHCDAAEALLASADSPDAEARSKRYLVIEKPLDSDLQKAERFAKFAAGVSGLCAVRVIDHYRGKWAVQAAAELLRSAGVARLTGAHFVSYETELLWPSECFDDGYFLEHAVHGFAALDLAAPGASARYRQGSAKGARYRKAGIDRDTFASAEFELFGSGVAPGATFSLTVGKGMPWEEKWLRVDGLRADGSPLSVFADIARKALWAAEGGGERLVEQADARFQDGYELLVPRMLSGGEAVLVDCTVGLDESVAWLSAVSKAVSELSRELPTYDRSDSEPHESLRESMRQALLQARPTTIP